MPPTALYSVGKSKQQHVSDRITGPNETLELNFLYQAPLLDTPRDRMQTQAAKRLRMQRFGESISILLC